MECRQMNQFLLGCVTLVVTLASAESCGAQSLWRHADPSMVFLFSDTSARRVGDLLTVIVRENTDVDNKDQRALQKNSDANVAFDVQANSSSDSAASAGSAAFDTQLASDRLFGGSSTYSVEQEFSDRITVSVLDVLPNGNLVIGGKRHRHLAGEARVLVISGIVRTIDIRADNTVESQFIGNFNVDYEGHGPESHFSNQGWLGRTANKIWPF